MDIKRLKTLNKSNDEYYTPREVWGNIDAYLPKDRVVWECFYNKDSHSAEHLRGLGCTVVYEDVDFFDSDFGEIIVTNPPFSMKEKVMTRLHELDKPFILLLPIHSVCTRFVKTLFKNTLQIIIPDTRIHYESKDENGNMRTLKRTSFDSVYVCYKMNLPRDMLWL